MLNLVKGQAEILFCLIESVFLFSQASRRIEFYSSVYKIAPKHLFK